MKICFEQFLSQNHSWSICGQNLARSFIKKKHEVHLKSTNGYEYFPSDLLPYVKETLDNNYDMQLSYTAMHNFPKHLSHGYQNRFGIWNYEFSYIPPEFVKYHNFTDLMLPSSTFSKNIFKLNKIPEEKLIVVPHGVDVKHFSSAPKFKLKTNKKYKILLNVAQPHIRKNIDGALGAFGKAFNKNDDVCLIIKIANKKPTSNFEISFDDIFQKFNRKFKNHAECEIITEFIPDIAQLYQATDIMFSMTHAECFFLPALEAIACNKVVICPRYGGQLDYLNDNNSLLIDGEKIQAPRAAQYWTSSAYSEMFKPSVEDASEKLKYCVDNYIYLSDKFKKHNEQVKINLTWDSATDKIISLCK